MSGPTDETIADLESQIADLEDQVEDLQRSAEMVAEEYEKDCSKALRGLVNLTPDVDWTDGLSAYEQADIVREHVRELERALAKATGDKP